MRCRITESESSIWPYEARWTSGLMSEVWTFFLCTNRSEIWSELRYRILMYSLSSSASFKWHMHISLGEKVWNQQNIQQWWTLCSPGRTWKNRMDQPFYLTRSFLHSTNESREFGWYPACSLFIGIKRQKPLCYSQEVLKSSCPANENGYQVPSVNIGQSYHSQISDVKPVWNLIDAFRSIYRSSKLRQKQDGYWYYTASM